MQPKEAKYYRFIVITVSQSNVYKIKLLLLFFTATF